MKKISYLVLIGEIIIICVLHTIKSNRSLEISPSAIEKETPVDNQKPDPAYVVVTLHGVFYKSNLLPK